MMFRWINKQGVEKDGEFSLQRIDRFHFEYSEKGNSIVIPSEPGFPYSEIFLSSVVATGDNFDHISKNVADALRFMGHKFRIV